MLLRLAGLAGGEPGGVIRERPAFGQVRPPAAGEGGVCGGDDGQDMEDAPAVQQDVVEGPHHADRVRADPDQGEPQQRRAVQGVAPGPLVGEQPLQLRVVPVRRERAPVVLGDRQRDVPVDHLERHGYAGERDGGTQDGGTVDDVLPGGGQGPHVAGAVRHERDLFDVQAVFRLVQTVHDHAGLGHA